MNSSYRALRHAKQIAGAALALAVIVSCTSAASDSAAPIHSDLATGGGPVGLGDSTGGSANATSDGASSNGTGSSNGGATAAAAGSSNGGAAGSSNGGATAAAAGSSNGGAAGSSNGRATAAGRGGGPSNGGAPTSSSVGGTPSHGGASSPIPAAPTWTQLYIRYLAKGKIGHCGDCHQRATGASAVYAMLDEIGQMNGLDSTLIVQGASALLWFGGSMPQDGKPSDASPQVLTDFRAWAAAGALDN